MRADASITALVNNAGIGVPTGLLDADIDALDQMIDLNVTALVHLTYAALPGFMRRGGGAIVNIASIVGIAPELPERGVWRHEGIRARLQPITPERVCGSHIRVQVVLPGATATDYWETSGTPLERLPSEIVMQADEMVDAALAGLIKGN